MVPTWDDLHLLKPSMSVGYNEKLKQQVYLRFDDEFLGLLILVEDPARRTRCLSGY